MNIPEFSEIIEPNDQTEARREHLEKLRALVGNVYPNKFDRSSVTGDEDTITRLVSFEAVKNLLPELAEGERPAPEIKEQINARLKELGNVRIAGRLATPPRLMGKAAFVHLSDGISRLQIYCRREDFVVLKNTNSDGAALDAQESWAAFGLFDHGDFVGVEGFLFITNTGELSVHVEKLQFLAKAMLPMPDKMHGIADPELRRRFRYADLIADSLKIDHAEDELTTREVFERRAKLISGMRRFLDDHGFIEVETPMLTPKATGAVAKPFKTEHLALGIDLYARIAPELYLKRLTVGGFEKVYELNRNFRNEGLSNKHNPEFTMLEFYCAYMDVSGMMDFAEAMIKESVRKANNGSLTVKIDIPINLYVPREGDEKMLRQFTTANHLQEINFESFKRISMKEAISEYIAKEYDFIEYNREKYSKSWFDDYKLTDLIWSFSQKMFHDLLPFEELVTPEIRKKVDEASRKAWEDTVNEYPEKAEQFEKFHNDAARASLIVETFELMVEKRLIQPTFIIDYPKSISPLSKASPENPQIAERFELFINGMECANGFSELNDPQEQYERFTDQMTEREGGDEEAMILDEDYIRALAYGMPPAAGIGIGIDRLVMLLTNRHSIRDVILFPHMRPEKREEAEDENGETES